MTCSDGFIMIRVIKETAISPDLGANENNPLLCLLSVGMNQSADKIDASHKGSRYAWRMW